MKKKKIVYQSDFSLLKTGFARIARTVLSYLYKTEKYDIVHYCTGTTVDNPDLKRTPWKSIGCLPVSNRDIQEINKDPHANRQAQYGAYYLDKIIQQEKPDIYIAVQDIWGVDFSINKKWFNKINSIIWTTLDSLPLLPSAIEAGKKVENYWIWSDFATKKLNELGHEQVKTVHGPIDHENFFKLPSKKKSELRKKFNISNDIFVIGFVFRNQLRKSVPNLLEGYKLFKEQNPKLKTKLLLHTYFSEGWGIHKLADEYKINKKEILATHVCNKCFHFEVKDYNGEGTDCANCGQEKSVETANIKLGVTEPQLNEIYNLMDVYCHPFTSGGQEIPIQEAKLTELVTLVTNYSCGEEQCKPEAHSLALEWAEYREHGTEFIKASTYPKSIAEQLTKVYNMPKKERSEWGKAARKWTINNYSIEKIGPKLEKILDNFPLMPYDFDEKEELKDPNYQVPEIKDDSEWLINIYHNVLKMTQVDRADDGHKYWMNEMSKGMTRDQIENYFRRVAAEDNAKSEQVEFSETLSDDDEGKRILYVMPRSIGDVFLSTSLFKSIKEQYEEYNLYIATSPANFEILKGNPYVHKVIPYISEMDDLLWLEGRGDYKGFFEIAFLPYVGTQKMFDYQHNGKDKIAFNIKY